MNIRILLLCGFALVTGPTSAAETSSVLATEFVRILRYTDQYQGYYRACLQSGSAVTPETLVRDNSDRFGGVRPATKYWPDIVAAYEKYYQEMCARPTEAEFLSALARAYATQLSVEDLKSAIAYYSSAIGQRLIAAHRSAAAGVYSDWTRMNKEHAPRANEDFEKRINDAARKANTRR